MVHGAAGDSGGGDGVGRVRREAWRRPDTRRHRGGRVAAKSQVYRFGPQNRRRVRCGRMFEMEGTWRHHEACVEAKRSREGGVSVRELQKKMDHYAPEWVISVIDD